MFPGEVLARAPHPPSSRFFLVWEWPEEYPGAIRQLSEWVRAGKLRYREDVVDGLENAPRAFIGMLRGENVGKRLVKIAEAAG